MARRARQKGNNGRLATQQSVNAAIKSICDIMRRSNCAGALQYVPELTWILFLRILDERETAEAERSEALGVPFTPSLERPYRWQDWAAPSGSKRRLLEEDSRGEFFAFVNGELLPHLRSLHEQPGATPRQKMISQIMSGVERTRIDTEWNFRDILDKVHEISDERVDETHVFTLSQVYEGLLLKMGERGNDGGQFFTPREIIRGMVRIVDPRIGETVYDPGCGTGGFARFEELFRLPPERTDSERSWTISLAERRRAAADEAEPLGRHARSAEQELARCKDRLAELRKTEPRDEAALAETEERVATLGREARDLRARAQAIAEAVYDLKAVNPHAKRDVDTRTPEELLDLIEAKGREVAEAIAALRAIGRR